MKQYPLNPTHYYTDFRDYIDGLHSYGNSPAICMFDRNAKETVKTYNDLYTDVSALRRDMLARGICGKRAAIAGENSYEWLVTFLAVTSAGGVAICLDTEQDDSTLNSMLAATDAEIVFTVPGLADIVGNYLGKDSTGRLFLINDEGESTGVPAVNFMIGEGEKLTEDVSEKIDPDSTAAIMFTSGTTALPKATELTHRNIMTNIGDSLATIDLRDSVFTCLPFYHAYGLCSAILYSLLMGARITVNSTLRFAMRDLYLSKAVTFIAVPLMLDIYYKEAMKRAEQAGKSGKATAVINRFAKFEGICSKIGGSGRKELARELFGETRTVICGGAHADPDVTRNIEAFGIRVVQGYGITECSPLVAVGRDKFHRRDTVGVLLPSYEIKFDEGEILLKGPSVMKGYYKNPEETAAVLRDGWLHTGDIGEITPEGYLVITGRLKNLIVLKNGKKISPEKIEQALLSVPLIKEVRVYGATCGECGDDVRPAATIYPDPELSSGYADFELHSVLQQSVDRVNDGLPAYQQIQMITIRDTPFERTSTGKMK